MDLLLQIVGVLAVTFCLFMFARPLLQFLVIPVGLMGVPGNFIAGTPDNWEKARGRFVIGVILTIAMMAIAAFFVVGQCVAITYFLRTGFPLFPAWLMWGMLGMFTAGIFLQAAVRSSKPPEEGEERGTRDRRFASILAWQLLWIASPFLFLTIALKPEIIHTSMEWMPYAQYAPGVERLEEPYRARIKETWTDLQRSTTASAPDMAKLTELFKTDKEKAKLQFADWLDASLSQFRLYVGSIDALRPPRRLQDFHSAFKNMYTNMLATYESITTKFRQEGDMAIFEKALTTLGQQMQDGMRDIEESLRHTNYGPEDFFSIPATDTTK